MLENFCVKVSLWNWKAMATYIIDAMELNTTVPNYANERNPYKGTALQEPLLNMHNIVSSFMTYKIGKFIIFLKIKRKGKFLKIYVT